MVFSDLTENMIKGDRVFLAPEVIVVFLSPEVIVVSLKTDVLEAKREHGVPAYEVVVWFPLDVGLQVFPILIGNLLNVDVSG